MQESEALEFRQTVRCTFKTVGLTVSEKIQGKDRKFRTEKGTSFPMIQNSEGYTENFWEK